MSAREGPPKKVEGRTPNHQGRPSTNAISDQHHADKAELISRVCHQPSNALRRRRLASQRMVPLDCCGCRDPWPRCTDPPLTERQLDYWRDAALHLLRAGHMPLLPLEARRALWRRGGADRVLAELLHDACGGEAA